MSSQEGWEERKEESIGDPTAGRAYFHASHRVRYRSQRTVHASFNIGAFTNWLIAKFILFLF